MVPAETSPTACRTRRLALPLSALALTLAVAGCRAPPPAHDAPPPDAPRVEPQPETPPESPPEPTTPTPTTGASDPQGDRGGPPPFGLDDIPTGEGVDPGGEVAAGAPPGRPPIGGWRALLVPELAYAAIADDRRGLDRLLVAVAEHPERRVIVDLALEAVLTLRGRQLELDAAAGRLARLLPPGRLPRDLAALRAGEPPSDALAACVDALDRAAPAPRARALREGLYAALAPGEVAVWYQRFRDPSAPAEQAPGAGPCAFPDDPGAGTIAIGVGKRADETVWQEAVRLPGTGAEHDRAACRLHAALSESERWPSRAADAVAVYALHPVVEVLRRNAGSGCAPGDRPLRLAVAPDAELHRVPLYGLSVAPGGRALIDGACTVRRVYGLRDFEPATAPPGRGVVAAAQSLPGAGPAVALRGRQYGPLKYAGDEVAAVSARLCPGPESPLCPAGATRAPLRDVDEGGLRRALARPPAVLHLAAHGDFEASAIGADARAGLDAAWLVLGPPRGGDAAGDNQLVAREVGEQLDLGGTGLAFLSACHSGRGAAARAEGLYGLPRAFHAAGAERVVASLWKVDDGRALGYARRFYAVLARTGDAEVALAEAARTQRALGSNDWAAFVVSGRGGALRPPSVGVAAAPALPAECRVQ